MDQRVPRLNRSALAGMGVALVGACALVGGIDDDYGLRPSTTAGTGGGGSSGCSIVAGGRHTCLLKDDATLWCWGRNQHGQIGVGTTGAAQASPVQVSALGADVAAQALGSSHTCARTTSGAVSCWGLNEAGQVGDGSIESPQAAPVAVEALGAVAQIAAGGAHSCAVKPDHTLWCWGDNTFGQTGNGTTDSPQPLPVQVAALGATVERVDVGANHTCAIKTDGTLWCWGRNDYGQIGNGTTDGPVQSPFEVTAFGGAVAQVAAGSIHTCALRTNGTLWCWGDDSLGQLGDGMVSVPQASPLEVTALGASVAQVTAGDDHTCARKQDGALWCWGNNDFGQIGDGTVDSPRPSPVHIASLGTTVAQVAAAVSFSCARKADGTIWCWGDNLYGQLGDGSAGTPMPFPAPHLAGITCRSE